ncbi:hypothetical protein SNE40_002542 [Patella caerulea]|uniref:C2H2-type domain-containing protein n=1 Tax=Patella caerulea TaxID=87958 RepID=A0AAN8QEC5_PATCE
MEDDVDFDFLLDNEVLDQVDTKPNSEKGDVLSCSNCDKSFRSRVTYIKHCQGCTGGNGSYSCNQCSAVFHEPVALDHHIQQHRLDTIASARLHAANKKHEMESSIAAMASSSLKSDHACGVCGHKFSSLIALQEHIPFHRFKLLNNHSSTIHGFS